MFLLIEKKKNVGAQDEARTLRLGNQKGGVAIG